MVVREIVWTKRASNSFDHIIDYLEIDFGSSVTKLFVQKTYHHVNLLSKYSKMGSIEDENRGIRGFVLSKHITLFYRTNKHQIIILNMFNNKMNPKRKKF